MKSESEVAQSCPTVSNTIDSSLPGSSVQGIFQARVLEWGAIAFSSLVSRSASIVVDLETESKANKLTWFEGKIRLTTLPKRSTILSWWDRARKTKSVNSMQVRREFLGDASSKEHSCQCKKCKRPEGNPQVRKISWRREWQPTLVFLLRESHGQRSLAGYGPWTHEGLNTTETIQRILAQEGKSN